jgi:spermidine synthase
MALVEKTAGLWFQEDLYPDIAFGLRVAKVLFKERSALQETPILDTSALGKVLALDGVVTCSQRDEAVYHRTSLALPPFAVALTEATEG